MPRILVTADEGDGRETVVLLHERVIPSELESDRLSARLIERVGWALVDADEVEQRTPTPAAARVVRPGLGMRSGYAMEGEAARP